MVLEKFLGWHEETLKTLQLNIAELLQEETRDLPASAEVEMFYQNVTQLERDALILEEKLNQLDGKPQ